LNEPGKIAVVLAPNRRSRSVAKVAADACRPYLYQQYCDSRYIDEGSCVDVCANKFPAPCAKFPAQCEKIPCSCTPIRGEIEAVQWLTGIAAKKIPASREFTGERASVARPTARLRSALSGH